MSQRVADRKQRAVHLDRQVEGGTDVNWRTQWQPPITLELVRGV